ncbi:amidohydrolase [Tessaracoccus lubricantis]|uniref:Amidohydrolase n=1 Tax=Tessaracoccus lubricantis TaxID=545543 RepID=A0ABP9FMJ0_9ACTN
MRHITALRNVRVRGEGLATRAVDLIFDGGLITAVEPAADLDAPGAEEVDGHGLLAMPTVVNAHAHVDKSWLGLEWQSYGGEGGTDGRIRHERARRDELGIPSVERTREVLQAFVEYGTTALRTHVDVDLGVGLRGIEAVREAVAEWEGALHAEIVAFPQDGVLRRDGVADLLRQAVRAGAEHVGGLDPAGIDRDPVGQVDVLLGIAADEGCGIDMHLHDSAELGAFQMDLVIERADRLGLHGRMNFAHGFAIAQVGESRRRDLLQAMGELGMTFTTVAPLRLPQLPLHEFDDAGVPFAFGTDGIRDLWSPYGTGDTLGIAWQYARSASIVRDEDLQRVMDLATRSAARFVGREVHDLVVGAPADVVLVDAEHEMDALVRVPRRELVVGAGRILHTAG